MNQRAEAIERILTADEAQRVNRGGEVEDKLAPACGFKIQHGREPFAAKDQIIGEQIAVNHTLGQFTLEIVIQVLDLVIERAADLAKIMGQAVAHVEIEIRNPLE